MYDARQIANWFVQRAARDSRELSIMSLLKLTYISHGWHLEMHGRPLFLNKIEAWQHGPVIPEIYHAFRGQGIMIKRPARIVGGKDAIAPQDEHLLEQVYDIYGHISPFKLSDMTHEAGGPWDLARKATGWYAPITDDLIRAHYVAKRKATAANV